MNINECVRDWINENKADHPPISEIEVSTGGEEGTEELPFIGVFETDSGIYEQDGVTMYGVTTYSINAELHTVPVGEDEDGTPAETEREMRDALNNILGDRAAIPFMEALNGWRVFDIRIASPTTEPEEGRRISRVTLDVTACPNT
jgi:hypothetical protein